MGKILIVGSGISGLSAAISLAQKGKSVVLLSPYASERAQSVMAAGGINAALNTRGKAIRRTSIRRTHCKADG